MNKKILLKLKKIEIFFIYNNIFKICFKYNRKLFCDKKICFFEFFNFNIQSSIIYEKKSYNKFWIIKELDYKQLKFILNIIENNENLFFEFSNFLIFKVQ